MINQLLKPIIPYLPENNRLELIWKLASIEFRKRYYDNALGIIWAMLNPLFRLIVYYFAFTFLLKVKMDNYVLYLFSGLLFWMFFTECTKKSLSVLRTKRYLIENIQFNKLDLFIASAIGVFFGFFFNIIAYFIISLVSGIPLYSTLIYLPLLLFNMFIISLGFGILLATLHIYLRDIEHLWDMLLLAGFWSAPIFFPTDILFEKFPLLIYLHPASGIIINFREVVLYGNQPHFYLLIYNFVYAILLLLGGIWLFKRYSHKAAEKL